MKKEKSQLIKTIHDIMPAVVSIAISKDLKELQKELSLLPRFFPFGAPKVQIPEENVDSKGRVQIGGGSGFFVDKTGIILTNKHVVADVNASYTVITNNDEEFEAEILARDPIDDVAILKITPNKNTKIETVEIGDSEGLELGQTAIAVGNALGLFRNTVSIGIVSGLSRSIFAQSTPQAMQEMRGLIQTDAAINPGNSGGPLVDIFGRAIGINTAIVFGAQNIGFAIPINAAKRDLNDVKEFGRIKRPLLGLRYITLDEKMRDKLKLSVDYGAYIISNQPNQTAVIPGSPAEKAKLKDKDIILECDGMKISRNKTLQDLLETMTVGQKIKLRVLRERKEFTTELILAERK
jgi:serine protease Do